MTATTMRHQTDDNEDEGRGIEGREQNDEQGGGLESAADVAGDSKDSTSVIRSTTTDAVLSRLLNRRHVYQNRFTGAVSSAAPLTTRQLCRILCPPSSTSSQQSSHPLITPETQLLAMNDDGTSYSNEGWKTAKTCPVLREATAQWYYEEQKEEGNSSSSPTAKGEDGDATNKAATVVHGPVNCRSLAAAVGMPDEASTTNTTTRVYSDECTDGTWIQIRDLPNLQAALTAFSDNVADDHHQTHQQPQQYDASVMAYDAGVDGSVGTGAKDNGQKRKDENETGDVTSTTQQQRSREVQDELELFLASTDAVGGKIISGKKRGAAAAAASQAVDSDDDETYESDGGTRYVKDQRTGKWVHEALMMQNRQTKKGKATAVASNGKEKRAAVETGVGNDDNKNNIRKKKNKKAKFSARNARCWVYVTGLPPDATEDEVAAFFVKAGILDLDPETQKPKIKLYRERRTSGDDDNNGRRGPCKGDASICYARPESVELALTLLDEAPFRPGAALLKKSNNNNETNNQYMLHVERAKFQQHGNVDEEETKKPRVSSAKRKVARLATKQAMDWDDGEFNGRLTGGLKGLRIIVLKRVFRPSDLSPPSFDGDNDNREKQEKRITEQLELRLLQLLEPFGDVDKMTVFSQNSDGVVVVKFAQPGAASDAVQALKGRQWNCPGKSGEDVTLDASFWDGVTDYTVRDEEKEKKEMERRHEEFGSWLDQQQDELPEELRLQTQNE